MLVLLLALPKSLSFHRTCLDVLNMSMAFVRSTNFVFIALLKFVFSRKATKIDEIFTVDLTLTTQCQIDGEDFVNLCGFHRKHEL